MPVHNLTVSRVRAPLPPPPCPSWQKAGGRLPLLPPCSGVPECWFRFRDDTFVLWRGTVERLNTFFTALNSFDQNLRFTMDIGGKSFNFLDLSITIKGKEKY